VLGWLKSIIVLKMLSWLDCFGSKKNGV